MHIGYPPPVFVLMEIDVKGGKRKYRIITHQVLYRKGKPGRETDHQALALRIVRKQKRI